MSVINNNSNISNIYIHVNYMKEEKRINQFLALFIII